MAHHEILEAVHCGTCVVLTNHSNSERGFLSEFRGVLLKMLATVEVKVSVVDEDPLKVV